MMCQGRKGEGRLVREPVAAVGVMGFTAGQRRRKGADQTQIALEGAQNMPVMLVERIHGARPDRPDAARGDIDHLAFALDAVIHLEMVLVFEMQLGAFPDQRVMKRTSHPVVGEDDPAALPAVTTGMPP